VLVILTRPVVLTSCPRNKLWTLWRDRLVASKREMCRRVVERGVLYHLLEVISIVNPRRAFWSAVNEQIVDDALCQRE
jgi:hypothetical protein